MKEKKLRNWKIFFEIRKINLNYLGNGPWEDSSRMKIWINFLKIYQNIFHVKNIKHEDFLLPNFIFCVSSSLASPALRFLLITDIYSNIFFLTLSNTTIVYLFFYIIVLFHFYVAKETKLTPDDDYWFFSFQFSSYLCCCFSIVASFIPFLYFLTCDYIQKRNW